MASLSTGKGNAGFTLIELLIVVGILGIMATVAMSQFSHIKEAINVTRCTVEIRGMDRLIAGYFIDKNVFPDSLNDVNQGGSRDPWGNAYVYGNLANGTAPRKSRFAVNLNADYDLYSKGKDGLTAQTLASDESKDDVLRAGDGVFVDIATEF